MVPGQVGKSLLKTTTLSYWEGVWYWVKLICQLCCLFIITVVAALDSNRLLLLVLEPPMKEGCSLPFDFWSGCRKGVSWWELLTHPGDLTTRIMPTLGTIDVLRVSYL